MLFYVIVACLCLVKLSEAGVMSAELRDQLIESGKKCYAEVGPDMELVLKIKDGVFTDDLKLKKHLLCITKSFGVQQKNGEYNEAAMKAILKKNGADDKKAETVAKKCLVKKDSPENSALELSKCIYNLIPAEEMKSLFEKM